MFTCHFGIDFDGPVYAPPSPTRVGAFYAGPQKLLHWLENQLGLCGYPENTDYLRIELYRQALGQHLIALEQDSPANRHPFYEKSFAADRFATAATLLAWRDELLLASNGRFSLLASLDGLPPRLATLGAVEALFQEKLSAPEADVRAFGFADRFVQVLRTLKKRPVPLSKIWLHEPEHLQAPHIQWLLQILRSHKIEIETTHAICAADAKTNLGHLQRKMSGEEPVPPAEAEASSILILRARRDSDAAVALAQIAKHNPAFCPVFLVPEMNLLLERALVLEGFPAMGILSASLARPSLQVLKLAPAFLWEPVDVFKIMEFATLPVKPLDGGLALEIARVLAEKPGMMSDTWFAAVYGYLEQAEVPDRVREQYEFWFGRRRYSANGTAPKREAIVIYNYLHEWALDYFDETGSTNTSLLVLAEQARRIRDLLETLPEQRITFLELERIVRTIYEPSPVQFAPAELGRFEFVHSPGALATPVDTLVWWNCLYENTTPTPDKWQSEERNFCEQQGWLLGTPRRESQLNLLRQMRPVLQTAQRLILVVPQQADGAEAVPNLLLGDIEATFPHRQAFTFRLDDETDRNRLSQLWQMPERSLLAVRPAGRAHPQLRIERPDLLPESEYETPTNLESLFYYPHRWFFRQKMRLFPSSLLSVTGDTTLLGSLAHRFFEKLLKDDITALDRRAVQEWVDAEAETLLPREGATLLLYGREPERNAFLNRVKNAAWSLVSLLRSNGWSVAHTELDLEGFFGKMPVRGKADLVLQRADELAIVDLKWSGARRRRELIKNGEDLQLVLYAHLLPPAGQWPHTAYFILEEGKMIARNTMAFKEAIVAGNGNEDHAAACEAIFQKMEKTFAWRMEQLQLGTLELRTARTAQELEAIYEGQLFELLEMKTDDAPWDDYRVLLEMGL
ncbi:MAG: PD-(D/E)XK nuclease family protein [Saprospiraceae bacterium]|nr:PD-(D/E)XK nuclease family protein [Saprospiraceae bacterium]